MYILTWYSELGVALGGVGGDMHSIRSVLGAMQRHFGHIEGQPSSGYTFKITTTKNDAVWDTPEKLHKFIAG